MVAGVGTLWHEPQREGTASQVLSSKGLDLLGELGEASPASCRAGTSFVGEFKSDSTTSELTLVFCK